MLVETTMFLMEGFPQSGQLFNPGGFIGEMHSLGGAVKQPTRVRMHNPGFVLHYGGRDDIFLDDSSELQLSLTCHTGVFFLLVLFPERSCGVIPLCPFVVSFYATTKSRSP